MVQSSKMNGKKKAAAENGFHCGNLDCGVTGRDKVDQMCAAYRAVIDRTGEAYKTPFLWLGT